MVSTTVGLVSTALQSIPRRRQSRNKVVGVLELLKSTGYPPTATQYQRLDALHGFHDHRQHVDIGDTKWRFHGEHVIAPPRPTTPPKRPGPYIGILDHAIKHTLNGRLTRRIVGACVLAQNTLLAMISEPLRSGCDALGADGRADAVWRGSRAI